MGSTEEVADEENNVQASVQRRNANAVPCVHQMAQGMMEEWRVSDILLVKGLPAQTARHSLLPCGVNHALGFCAFL